MHGLVAAQADAALGPPRTEWNKVEHFCRLATRRTTAETGSVPWRNYATTPHRSGPGPDASLRAAIAKVAFC